MMRTLGTMLVLCCFLATVPPASGARSPEARCAAAKLTAAAQKAQKRAKCVAAGVLDGGGATPECLAKIEARFTAAWARIEARGGCATSGDADAIEGQVNAFVADLLQALSSSTTTTTTTGSTCPPTTAFYCGPFCGPIPVALCPVGMSCVSNGSTCGCEGPAIPCGNLRGDKFCRWGTCPPGMTCGEDPASTTCPRTCGCF